MRRTLYEKKSKALWIKIDVYLSLDEKLVVHGHDSGQIVESIKDQYDYEYFLTIDQAHIDKLIQSIESQPEITNREMLLDWMCEHFSTDQAVSQIKEELDRIGIPYQFSTW